MSKLNLESSKKQKLLIKDERIFLESINCLPYKILDQKLFLSVLIDMIFF